MPFSLGRGKEQWIPSQLVSYPRVVLSLLFLLGRLGFDFVFGRVVDVNLVRRRSRRVKGRPLTPIVAAGIGKEIPLRVKGGTRNRLPDRVKGFQALLVVLIPKGHHPVRSDRRKGPEGVLKGDTVDAIYLGSAPVALEGKVVFVSDLLDVLDPDASLDAAQGKTGLIGKTPHAPRLVLEGGFLPAVLPRLSPADVVDNKLPVGGTDDHEVAPDVHVVDAVGKLEFPRRSRAARVPEL
mmetsp:Transcript_9115/g.19121  ORF Transcript_9115/g.19121 Transcript_9115/m.19121 type:complete len:237 (-) Transcript_9115:480-1190(-)